MTEIDLRPILEDIGSASDLSDYEATEVLWVALVKLGNLMAEGNEHRRMLSLVRRMPAHELQELLGSSGVADLINVDPPLETILSSPHERLNAPSTARAIETIRSSGNNNPHEAAVALGEILKRVRNKRAHGFKTRSGPRDQEILRAARQILAGMCDLGVRSLST